MLEKVEVSDEATYSAEGQALGGLKNINFVFGSNGSGKTTISRVLSDPASHPTSRLEWQNARPIETLVYNTDFSESNFASEMPGIFTLGEESKEALQDIEVKRKRASELQGQIDNLENNLGLPDQSTGKRSELRDLRNVFENQCWDTIKIKHDADFHGAFSGLRNSKQRFCDRAIEEFEGNSADLVGLDDLKARAETVFAEATERLQPFTLIDARDLIAQEANPVLAKKVIGKEDIDVAGLIRRLENSDWVRKGLDYITEEDGKCPFCQQDITAALYRNLNSYFDETYINDISAITTARTAYNTFAEDLIGRLEAIATSGSRYIDMDSFRADLDRLSARIEINRRTLVQKGKEPSSPVKLEGVEPLTSALQAAIQKANTQIATHNTMIDNLATEQAKLKAEIWKCIIEESRGLIETYASAKLKIDKAIEGLSTAVMGKKAELTQVKIELREIEKKITSVQPTVEAINRTLASFGFTSFKLAPAGMNNNRYRLVRGDGSDAAKTLSEGEKSFITFLYFYHLIRGSHSESGSTADRIVVFDDPVSSLDSDVLFIVSTLIKDVLREACSGSGRIKQAFVLTHNIYFHKEVSYDRRRSGGCMAHETFWIVRKIDGVTQVTQFDHNPIKTSYELLWNEVKVENRSNTTIQNTLRRIVENYFKILGGVDTTEIIGCFEGNDQQIASSLFSWVNDGSHSVHDDLYISADDQLVERYLRVFREIFEKSDHGGHYRMMMGLDSSAATAPDVNSVAA